MKASWRGFLTGWVIILFGAVIAHLTQTSNGITIKDVRFDSQSGAELSALLYVPAGASAQNKAPGILAVHGYINSREVQSGFAIEFARRGYVVLALDQMGHGYSAPPAFAEGFGGPAALLYLRSLEMVDTNNIGLEGHSMGGWTVLAAASTLPAAYTSMVLQGSSTGPPFAAHGTASWPRNVAVVFSQFDEFSQVMWGVDKAQDVARSDKLQTLFATNKEINVGQTYGDIVSGTARILLQPPVTHPGDHISHAAIGHAIDWFAQTLSGGTPLPSEDQIWFRKEIGTLIALIGFVVLMLGSFQLLLSTPMFSPLSAPPTHTAYSNRTYKWWAVALLTAIVPVATFYIFFSWAEGLLPPSAWMPQSITNQVVFWALANVTIASIVALLAKANTTPTSHSVVHCILIALITVSIGYLSALVIDWLFLIDFRFWFVGIKVMSLSQFIIALPYLLPFLVYFLFALRGLHHGLSVQGDNMLTTYGVNAAVLMGGFLIFLTAQYVVLFNTGALLTPDEPLNTIVMMQFVPLLLIVSIISTFTYRRTGSYLPGAVINGLWVTWYIVAGQATQFAS